MRLELIVRLASGSAAVEHPVVVEAPVGATLADLAAAVRAAAAPGWPDGAWTARDPEGTPIPASARLGSPPLLDGARVEIGEGTGSARAGRPPAAGPLELHVIGGPDTGRVHPLAPGRHTVGRAADAELVIADPAMSRLHAELEVGEHEVRLADRGSTNGTWLGVDPVTRSAVTLAEGTPVRTGDSRWCLRRRDPRTLTARPDGAGHLLVSPPGGGPPGFDAPAIQLPEPPTDAERARLPVLAAVLPAGLSGVLAVVLHSPTMLLFGLMSPLLLLGSWWSDRRSGRRACARARERYAAELAAARERTTGAMADEATRLRAAYPDPAGVAALAASRSPRLWERTGGPLLVRMGTGRAPATTRVTGPVPGDFPALTLADVPVVAELGPADWLGLAGPTELVDASARWIVGQLAVAHSPAELAIVAGPVGAAWAWLTQLPHALPWPTEPAEPAARTQALLATAGGRRVLVVAGTDPGLEAGEGLHVLVLAPRPEAWPAPVRVRVDLTDPAERCADPDTVPAAWAARLAAQLRPLRDPAARQPGGGLPDQVGLLDLLAGTHGLASVDARPDLGRLWTAHPRSTRIPLGAGIGGTVVVDLAADGPHALVGGTTGAGKSELLLTLVAGLAAVNRPDELSFVLVDFKGGAAFDGCRELPHVLGVVTDLDAGLAERALTALRAELRRREGIFATRGAGDLPAYQHSRQPGDPVVGRLVIVVDELRALAEQLPDFVAGLVRIGSLGRSLGVHLVLATQRPAGVITADLRANVGLRIALRVRDLADSLDVIDAPDAARLPAAFPGRAVLTSAATPLTTLQTARVSGPAAGTTDALRIVSLDGRPARPHRATGPSELDQLVRAAREAATALGATTPPSPWPEPLPERLVLADPRGDLAGVVLGLADHPTEQVCRPWVWDPHHDGHLGISGTARTGRTTALLTLADALARRFSPAELHLYAVHAGSLAGLDAAPHVGASVDVADLPRWAALLDLLESGLARGGEPVSQEAAYRVLLVDDWEQLGEALDRARAGALRDRLVGLLRAGPGLVCAVAGGQALLSSGLGGAFGRRVLLLPADPVALAMAGLGARSVPARPPRGRAIDLVDGLEVQLGVSADAPPSAGQVEAARSEVAGGPAPSGAANGRPPLGPPRIPALPATVAHAALSTRPGTVPWGHDGRDPVGIDPAIDRRVAVLGPRGSGRSTALHTLALSLAAAGRRVVFVTADPTNLVPAQCHPGSGELQRIRPDEVDRLVALRREDPALAVLVDDADRLRPTDTPAAGTSEPVVVGMFEVLREIERRLDPAGGLLAVAATPRAVLDDPRGLAGLVAHDGTGLLLGALEPTDAAALGLTGRLWPSHRPGRGYLVRAGRAVPVQVATP